MSDGDPRARCLCGLSKPSRVHLTWACSETRHLRQGLRPSQHRGEERSLAADVGDFPPPPVAVALADYQEDVTEALRDAIRDSVTDPNKFAEAYVSTDGSCKLDVAGFAVIVRHRDHDRVFSTGDDSEDQSSFRAECYAVSFVAKAADVLAREGVQGHVALLVDCQAALDALVHPAGSSLPSLMGEARRSLDYAARRGLVVTATWVPAHGRRPGWVAPHGLCTQLCRVLNHRADKSANQARERRYARSARQAWHLCAEAAREWSTRAIYVSAAAAGLYKEHIAELRG